MDLEDFQILKSNRNKRRKIPRDSSSFSSVKRDQLGCNAQREKSKKSKKTSRKPLSPTNEESGSDNKKHETLEDSLQIKHTLLLKSSNETKNMDSLSSSSSISCSIDSGPLTKIYAIFQHLNTIYTFCSTSEMIPCYESLKTYVENGAKQPFRLSDLGLMVAIAPEMIKIYWVMKKDLQDEKTRLLKSKDELEEDNIYVLAIEFIDARPPSKFNYIDYRQAKKFARYRASLPAKITERDSIFKQYVNRFVKKHEYNLLPDYELNHDQETKYEYIGMAAIPKAPGKVDNVVYGNQEWINPDPWNYCLKTLVTDLKKQTFYRGQIPLDGIHLMPERIANYEPFNKHLSKALIEGTNTSFGVKQLYSHQRDALQAIHEGKNVIVTTSTSSGKSLIYQLPTLHTIQKNANKKAMFIFPTKALAQDQKRSLHSLLSQLPHLKSTIVDSYDGDTPMTDIRSYIREKASIIITNPDMLHTSILPYHESWRSFLMNLKFVIVDELHFYNSVFGNNCAMVMRRLRRILNHYHNHSVQFVSCSATISNPQEFMSQFFGIDNVCLVDRDGSPMGEKSLVVWNPPLKNMCQIQEGRLSFMDETCSLVCSLIQRGLRVICFAKYRKACEVLLKMIQSELKKMDPNLARKVMSYRGGYTISERREIERKLFNGELLGVVATNALELGVDIGSLDAVVHCSFPMNKASYRQQVGRAGRRGHPSISFMVADGDNVLDQHYAAHPEELFSEEYEKAILETENELLVCSHLQCASIEFPIEIERDVQYFHHDITSMKRICDKYLLYDGERNLYFCSSKYEGSPARHVSLRETDNQEAYRVIDVTTMKDIEDIESKRAPFTLYEGAILIHQGSSFVILEVNTSHKIAKARPTNVDYITSNRKFTNVDPITTLESKMVYGYHAFYGEIQVTKTIFGYTKIDPVSKRVLGRIEDDEKKPLVKQYHGFWIDIPDKIVVKLIEQGLDVEYSIHGAAHAILSLIPTLTTASLMRMSKIKTECKTKYAKRIRPPRISLYDDTMDSMMYGLIFHVYQDLETLLNKAHHLIANCTCLQGCVACIYKVSCSQSNTTLEKRGALMILDGFIESHKEVLQCTT